MADFPEGDQALAFMCAKAIYPQGLGNDSITGRRTVIRRGWPSPNDRLLLQDKQKEVDFVSVTMDGGADKVVSAPLYRSWEVTDRVYPNVILNFTGEYVEVVFPFAEKPVGIIGIWASEDRKKPYVYAVNAEDTAQSVVKVLAGLIPGSSADGAMLYWPSHHLEGRVVGYGKSECVERRQRVRYRVSVWTNNTVTRDYLGNNIDVAMADQDWIKTLDGREAQLKFVGIEDVDNMQNQHIFRRDYLYDLIFDIVKIEWSAEVLWGADVFNQSEDHLRLDEKYLNISKNALNILHSINVQKDVVDFYGRMKINQFGIVVE
ncbi:hypothetical protein [Swingsia samuiensis]|uniref:Uncharacterized protein n=1 Tax=Swingsia samuiensis TaxID=1293412 RepID=A0A4Y6UK83_9PROT|nr:hypothetical protein [Swingsia samuiensis]QDH16787.1 hypothetical protein E3D00_03790 [Swingsia samuiensis]